MRKKERDKPTCFNCWLTELDFQFIHSPFGQNQFKIVENVSAGLPTLMAYVIRYPFNTFLR